MEVQIEIPTADDFAAIAKLKAEAFADKMVDDDRGRELRHYQSKCPDKVQHLRVAKIDGNLAGALQLQIHDDPGDYGFPGFMQHVLQGGEAYIEFIATGKQYRGKGVGSKLLAWAEEFSRGEGCRILTLDVVKRNEGALRLYERKGFVIDKQTSSSGSYCCASVVLCLISCGKYYNGCFFMVKDLKN